MDGRIICLEDGAEMKYGHLPELGVHRVLTANKVQICAMASSSSSQMTIQPVEHGGYGNIAGELFGGLKDRAFKSRCPPIVTPDTIRHLKLRLAAFCPANS